MKPLTTSRFRAATIAMLISVLFSFTSNFARAQEAQIDEQRLQAEIAVAKESRRAAHEAYNMSLKSKDMANRAATKAKLDAAHARHQQLQAQLTALRAQRRARHDAQVAANHAATAARHAAEQAKDQASHQQQATRQANIAKEHAAKQKLKEPVKPKG